MKLVIFTDGASRDNPGNAAIGYVIMRGEQLLESGGEYIGIATNNEAEYRALIKALKEARKYKPTSIDCYSDSNLMIHQLNGDWRIKAPQLMDYHADIKRLINGLDVSFTHVKRDNKGVARCDALANQALDEAGK